MPVRMAIMKKKIKTNIDEDVEKLGLLHNVGRNEKWSPRA